MLPLENLRVLDFSQRLPGPYCTAILGDLGAEVLMVEVAGNPPETRSVFPGLLELVNRNKKSITLNMKNSEAREIADKLIRQSHVLVEEFRPGVAERIGIGYDRVKAINPSIIYCSISGFGQDGPYRDRVGHDLNYLSLSGILSIPGQPDAPPSRPGVPLVDLASGMFAAISVLASLLKKERDGTGEYIDISMFDAMISWMAVRAGRILVHGEALQNEHLSPLNNVYETKDGKKISLGLIEQHFLERFCRAAGREDLLEDARFASAAERRSHSSDLLKIMRVILAGKTWNEWESILDWRQVPYAPVNSVEEALNDAHVQARGLLQEIGVGESGKIREVLFPAKFRGFGLEVRRPPPAWGEHTDEILEELGYSREERDLLRQRKAI